jgi:hypothetical protein
MFFAPVFFLIVWFFSLSNFVIPSKSHMWEKYNGFDDNTYVRKAEEANFWDGHDWNMFFFLSFSFFFFFFCFSSPSRAPQHFAGCIAALGLLYPFQNKFNSHVSLIKRQRSLAEAVLIFFVWQTQSQTYCSAVIPTPHRSRWYAALFRSPSCWTCRWDLLKTSPRCIGALLHEHVLWVGLGFLWPKNFVNFLIYCCS